MHVISEMTKGDSASYLPLKEKHLHNGKDSLGQSDHETAKLNIPRGISRINSNITILEFKGQI